MRLLLISLGVLGVSFVVGVIVRLWGLSLPYKKFEHPFFDRAHSESQLVRIPVLNTKHFGPELTTIDLPPNNNVIWVNFYITSDNQLVTDYGFDENDFFNWAREKNKFKSKFIHEYSFNDLAQYQPNLVPLEAVLEKYKTMLFVLNVLSNQTDVHKNVIEVVEKFGLKDQVLVNSPIDVVIKAVKEQRPMWLYGTSMSEVTRLKSFSTMGLEPAISIRGDVFIAPISYMNRRLMNESLVSEMKRRKKMVLIGPVNSEEERKLAEEFNPDGIVF